MADVPDVVVVLFVALAEGCGAGAVEADEDALADGFETEPPFVLIDSEPAEPAATLVEALADALGSGSFDVDGLALAEVAGAAKPPLATTAS